MYILILYHSFVPVRVQRGKHNFIDDLLQAIGPFLLVTSPPLFDGEIVVRYYSEDEQNYLVASWSDNSFLDETGMLTLDYQYAVGKLLCLQQACEYDQNMSQLQNTDLPVTR